MNPILVGIALCVLAAGIAWAIYTYGSKKGN